MFQSAMAPISLPHFSHQPHRWNKATSCWDPISGGVRRWPGVSNPQSFSRLGPSTRSVCLFDVLVWVESWLSPCSRDRLKSVSKNFAFGSLYSGLWLTRPWMPIRRRLYGSGASTLKRHCSHETPHLDGVIHFAWIFLTPGERKCAVTAFSAWRLYAYLRRDACRLSLSPLQAARGVKIPNKLSRQRALLHSVALLRFDFQYSDLVRWLGKEYTNRDCDWAPSAEAKARNAYDNHPAVDEAQEKVEEKFAKEEWKAYHIHFLRFLYAFIPGLMINPIQWIFDKGKGRLCIDCTNGPDPSGSANTYIPKPGTPERLDECPPVWYQYAFKRLLRHIYRLRRTKPGAPLLVHADDIEAAFRRVLYHPDLAVAFAYVFNDFVIVPVGQVFGSRSAPSYYCLLADIRQVIAAMSEFADDPSEYDPLVKGCTFSTSEDPVLA